MRLSQLRKNLEDMSLDELREHVRRIREDRKITKVPRGEKKVRAKRSDKAKTTTAKALAKMSPEELNILLRELGDEDAGSSDRQDQGEEQS